VTKINKNMYKIHVNQKQCLSKLSSEKNSPTFLGLIWLNVCVLKMGACVLCPCVFMLIRFTRCATTELTANKKQ